MASNKFCKKSVKLKYKNIIIGSSHAKHLAKTNMFDEEETHIVALSGQGILEAKSFLEQSFFIVQNIVIMIGSNNISNKKGSAISVSAAIAHMCEMLNSLKTKYPRANVYLSEIPPREEPFYNDAANEFNRSLRGLCSEKQIYFIEQENLWEKHGCGFIYLSRDGVHLTDEGSNECAMNLLKALNKQ